MGSNCVYLVNFSLTQPTVGTLIQVLSLTCASGCNKCARFHHRASRCHTCVCACRCTQVSASSTLQRTVQGTGTTCQVLQARSWQQRRQSVDRQAETCHLLLLIDEPWQNAPIMRDGARSVQTREPTSEARSLDYCISDLRTMLTHLHCISIRTLRVLEGASR